MWFSGVSTPLKAAPDGNFFWLHYEDAAASPRAKVIALGEKMKRTARQVLPTARLRTSGFESYLYLQDPVKDFKGLSWRRDKKENYIIHIPDSYEHLIADPSAPFTLMSWITLGRGGYPVSLTERLRDSWFIVGMTRKILEDMQLGNTPFSGYFPAAYVLTSRDHFPSLRSLLSVPLPQEDTVMRMIYEEYCQLLVLICTRNNLFRSGLLTGILNDFSADPGAGMYELFKKHALPQLRQKEKRFFPVEESDPAMDNGSLFMKQFSSDPGSLLLTYYLLSGDKQISSCWYGISSRPEYDPDVQLDRWFRHELDFLLNIYFLPASPEKIESGYREAMTFEMRLESRNGKEKKKSSLSARKKKEDRPLRRSRRRRGRKKAVAVQPVKVDWKRDPLLESRNSFLLSLRFLPVDLLDPLYRSGREKGEVVDFRSAENLQKRPANMQFPAGGVSELIRYHRKIYDFQKVVNEMGISLLQLRRYVSPDLQLPVMRVRNALMNFAANPGSASAANQLREADSAFYAALEHHIALKRFLDTTEQEMVSPAARYILSFRLFRLYERPEMQISRRLTEFFNNVTSESGDL